MQRRAWGLAVLASTLLAAHLARLGTLPTRIGAAALIAGVSIAWLVATLLARRAARRSDRAVVRVIARIDEDLAARTRRAIALQGRTEREGDPVGRALAAMHLEGLAARVGLERLERAATKARRTWGFVALGIAAVALIGFARGPLRVLEGLDVMMATGGRAPVPMQWIEDIACGVQVPRYLRQEEVAFQGFGRTAQPRGSVLSVHVLPIRADRVLVLTDGKSEVPFVDDGQGALVAGWVLAESVRLEVAARFGDVLIPQRDALHIESQPDTSPRVTIQGAPRTVRLMGVSEIVVAWEALDDHGLTEVDLVLRTGEREERRVLARLDGQQQQERGSSVVRPTDRFLKQAWAPIEITVEARDNDPITGPKWGRAPSITVIPPAVGEAEARRYQAARGIFGTAVDLLAGRITASSWKDAKEAREHAQTERTAQERLAEEARRVMAETFGGLSMPAALTSVIAGNVEQMDAAVVAEHKAQGTEATRKAHERTRAASERAVLAIDTALQLLGNADAAKSARRLADAADEAAAGARLARGEQRERGMARVNASVEVLTSGAEWIGKLDRLGKDLGEVIGIGARRIQRALQAGDVHAAELAAEDLAMRLRRPLPSFSGGGGRRSTEAGGSTGGDPGEPGEEPEAAELRDELGKLAREHGDAMKELEQELAKAMGSEGVKHLRDQAREHAKAVRDAVRALPPGSADSTSAEGAAATARQSAMSMAEALDDGNLPEAVLRGRASLSAAEQAGRMAGEQRDFFGNVGELGEQLERSRGKLEREVRWAEQQLEQLRRAQADQAREAIDRTAATEEELAKRAGDASRKGEREEAAMPRNVRDLLDDAQRSMREASRALRGRSVDKGVEQQREAQRKLEMARELQGKPGEEEGQERAAHDDDTDGGREVGGHVDVPKAEAFKGPEAYRKRVLEGLAGGKDPRLREAVKRYAEGMLR